METPQIPQENTPEEVKKSPMSVPAAILTGAAMIAFALILVLHPNGTPAAGTVTAPTPSNTSGRPTTPTTVPAAIVTVRPNDTDHIRGDVSKAQILLFEYSDSDCPYCEQFHPTLQKIVNDYQGKVAWIYRYFPLDIHPNSRNEAIALQCAGNLGGAKAFNTYLDTVINITLNPDPKSDQMLTTIAGQQGLDTKKFDACRADPATAATIDAGIKEAESIGAQGTPFSIAVNVKTGKQVIIPGAYPYADMKKNIDSLL